MKKLPLHTCFLVMMIGPGCTCKPTDTNKSAISSSPQATASGVEVMSEILMPGSGAEATEGSSVTVHYVGTLAEGGQKFDSSVDRNMPFTFKLGAQEVIRGWDAGVKGMKVGEKRRLTIPPELAYGRNGAGTAIPPNATLVFEIELLDVK